MLQIGDGTGVRIGIDPDNTGKDGSNGGRLMEEGSGNSGGFARSLWTEERDGRECFFY